VVHLDEIHAYVPQVREKGFVYPLLACDTSNIDQQLLDWDDKENGYSPHNLMVDFHKVTRSKPLHPVFSTITQFDPNV
jgi:hypothetical protein